MFVYIFEQFSVSLLFQLLYLTDDVKKTKLSKQWKTGAEVDVSDCG